jgi:hypothetical protein
MVISGSEQLKVFWCYDSGVEYINKIEGNKELKSRKKANKKILNPDPVTDTTTTVTPKIMSKKKKVK